MFSDFLQVLNSARKLQKIQINYGWKEFEIRNNFSYRNFSKFEIEFELKFREVSMS
jgi:hypothetical protein